MMNPALSSFEYEAMLATLADAIIEDDLKTREVTIRVPHGLPDQVVPRHQPELWEWWSARIAAGDAERVTAGITSVMAAEQDSWMDEYAFEWQPMTTVHVVHRAILLRDEQGHPSRIAHILQNATARRAATDQLLAERDELEARVAERTRALTLKNAELGRALQHKDDFLASMSHELRTPLSAVLGLAEAMLEELAGPINELQRSWLKDVAASGKHLLGLINDILDLARIESGRLELSLQRVSPAEVANSAVKIVTGAAMARGVRVVTDLPPDLPLLTTDPRYLRQVLLNLLGNAVKFTPPHGTITVSARTTEQGDAVRFSVADTGIGIPPDRLTDIFKPFVQVDGGIDRQSGGSGLGLALVARMTERLAGSVQVESTVGVGSVFGVTIPSLGGHTRDSNEAEVDPAHAPRPRALRVLLAEDNPLNVRTFREYLTAKGMEVEVASDGEAAVAAVKARHPDIVLMDMQMPRMDGMQATRLIRADPEIGHVPIIALTALAMPGDRERCLEAGTNAYIAKPVRLRELLQLMDELTPRDSR
jgi:signal transduction histidine kinase/ActR/RegA family two-component response regulator